MLLKSFIISILLAGALLITACPAPCDMNDEEIKNVHAELAPIAEAIENFRRERKTYPHSLNELAPQYLEKIATTVGGRKFEYIRVSDDKYNLRVEARNGGSYSGSCSYMEIDERRKSLGK